MRYTDARATNLFARLFSYAPRPILDAGVEPRSRQRNALEDFCTEALAWCLVDSKPFADRLFALDCFVCLDWRPEGFQVDTQQSHKGEDEDDEEDVPKSSRSRFDLVLTSSKPVPIMVVIESKVAPDKSENIVTQITTYRDLVDGAAFKGYTQKKIILLTPYAANHNADSHLSWDQVHDILRELVKDDKDPQAPVFRQFADFLKLRHLAKMKLPKAATLLPSLKEVAPLLKGLEAVFDGLRNDEVVKTIFARRDVLPKMDVNADDGEDYLWYGIWSRRSKPFYLVGFHTSCSGDDPLLLSVQVMIEGDRTSEKVPEKLKVWFDKSSSGKEDTKTNFVFTTTIDAAFDGNPGAIEAWIIERIRDIDEWMRKIGITNAK